MMAAYRQVGTPGAPHALLAGLEGSWISHSRGWMEPGQPPMEGSGTCEQKMILGGRYLQQEYTGEMMGETFHGINLVGYDNHINRLYRYGMSPVELYDATRSAWKVRPREQGAELAFAVYEGVIREVYRITGWLPAGSTFNHRYGGQRHDRRGRFEFVGVIAEDRLRKKYVNRYVGFAPGAQNPVSYVNLDGRPAGGG